MQTGTTRRDNNKERKPILDTTTTTTSSSSEKNQSSSSPPQRKSSFFSCCVGGGPTNAMIFPTRNCGTQRKRARRHCSYGVESPPPPQNVRQLETTKQPRNKKGRGEHFCSSSFRDENDDVRIGSKHHDDRRHVSRTNMTQNRHSSKEEDEEKDRTRGTTSTHVLSQEGQQLDIKNNKFIINAHEPRGEGTSGTNSNWIIDSDCPPPPTSKDEWIDKLLCSLLHDEDFLDTDRIQDLSRFPGKQTAGNSKMAKNGVDIAEVLDRPSESIPVVDAVSELSDDDDDKDTIDDHPNFLLEATEPTLQNGCYSSIEDNDQVGSFLTFSRDTNEVAHPMTETSRCLVESHSEPTNQNFLSPRGSTTQDDRSPFLALAREELEKIALWQLFVSSEQTQVPMLLTLTSFPFRVVHANHAFYTTDAFQVSTSLAEKILGMGIGTLVPRQNGAPTMLANAPSFLEMYKRDEIVDVNLPIDQGHTTQSIPCKINVYAVMKGQSRYHEPQGYHGSSNVFHDGGLRYFAVQLTPISSIRQSQHAGP